MHYSADHWNVQENNGELAGEFLCYWKFPPFSILDVYFYSWSNEYAESLRPEKGQRKIRDLMKISERFKSYLKLVDRNFPIKFWTMYEFYKNIICMRKIKFVSSKF